jgi:hypothetical protein
MTAQAPMAAIRMMAAKANGLTPGRMVPPVEQHLVALTAASIRHGWGPSPGATDQATVMVTVVGVA